MPLTSIPALALAAGLVAGATIIVGLEASGRVAAAARWISAGFLLAGIVLALSSAAFDGYDTDLWFHVLVIERVADGEPVWDREPFRLQPPADPRVAPVFILLGLIRRTTGIPALALVRLLSLGSLVLLSLAAWTLAGKLFPDPRLRWAAAVLFWLAMPDQWGSVGLGRALSHGFALLAAASALELHEGAPGGPRRALTLAVWIALAFHSHIFGGLLAVGAAGLALVVRWREGRVPAWRDVLITGGLVALLAAPVLSRALATWRPLENSAHLSPRRGQVVFLGLRWLAPEHFLGMMPLPLWLLAAVGLLSRADPAHRLSRKLAGLGALFTLLALLTPLYHVGVGLLGGWVMIRIVALAFPWVAGALALARLFDPAASQWGRALGALAILGLTCGDALELAGALLDRPVGLPEALGLARGPSAAQIPSNFAFSPHAQSEALTLRPVLKDRAFVSADLLGYGLAAGTLGRPLSIPPGHASPFDDVVKRKRWVDRALFANTPACWAALFRLHPEIDYLLTPAPDARVERGLWQTRLFETPEALRARLAESGALEPAFRGRYFVVDRIRNPLPEAAPGSPPVGEGKGRLCP